MTKYTAADKRLLQAAGEALEIACGTADPATYRVHTPPNTVDVRAIRLHLNMTQVAFGERFGFGKARVRDWEQKRTRPAASDRVLLTTIKQEPDAVLRALAAEAGANAEIGVFEIDELPANAVHRPVRKPRTVPTARKQF